MSLVRVAGIAAMILSAGVSGAQTNPQFPEQGWTPAIRDRFWFTDQGSKLIPYDWFLKLERAGSTEPFARGLERYGFVPHDFGSTSQLNPDRLPIGFAIHNEGGQRYAGLTCAACHVARIDYQGKRMIVDGAPSLLNFDLFFGDLVDALQATAADPAKLKRLGADPKAFADLTSGLVKRRRINTTPVPAGFGRVDAFGQILNQVAIMALNNSEDMAGVPDAPASYPFLWDIAQHETLQWNGSAPNLGLQGTGSKLRNIGEVLGVFGEVTIPGHPGDKPSYASSVNLPNLEAVETWITTLRPPAWPQEFGKPAAASVAAGQKIYSDQCESCHAVLGKGVPKYPIRIAMTPADLVQTDRKLIDNFRLRAAGTKQLNGLLTRVSARDPLERFGPQAPMRKMAGHVTLGAYAYAAQPGKLMVVKDAAKAFKEGDPDLSAYKARPLDGIWATAPYLHNGSVPSLRELLKKPRERMQQFCVGSFEYDPDAVGYRTDCGDRTAPLDTTRTGNSNQGHEYGVWLSDQQKSQLLDYLKTL